MPMRLALTLAIALLVPLSGCIANMGELKEALGAVPEPEIVPAAIEPPLAHARADTLDARVGDTVRFASDGSIDPQSFPLAFGWDFGDGARAEGATATHAFLLAGEYRVTLRAVSTSGLSDEDALTVRVRPLDRAPSAAIRVLDASGASIVRANAGDALTFDGASSSDPEGSALIYVWSFGDGATSADATPTHAYAAPGAYEVSLLVQDAAGQQATSRARVAIDAALRETGAFEAPGADVASFPFAVAHIARFDATIAFPAQMGLASLQLVVKDAAGNEIARTSDKTAPATQGDAMRTLVLDAGDIAAAVAGGWTIEVVRESGVAPTFSLEISAFG